MPAARSAAVAGKRWSALAWLINAKGIQPSNAGERT